MADPKALLPCSPASGPCTTTRGGRHPRKNLPMPDLTDASSRLYDFYPSWDTRSDRRRLAYTGLTSQPFFAL